MIAKNDNITLKENKNNIEKMDNKKGEEPTTNNSNNNIEIKPDDVLCGRGGLTNTHVGNRKFRHIVGEFQQEYLVARKKAKREIAEKVVAQIHANGGRFLKMDKQSDGEILWKEVPKNKAVGKTSQCLREGLDVRRKTVRPEKKVRKYEDLSALPTSDLRKRAKLVQGMVGLMPQHLQTAAPMHPAFAPPRSHLQGVDMGDVPEMRDEQSAINAFEPMFNFNYPHAMMQLNPTLGMYHRQM